MLTAPVPPVVGEQNQNISCSEQQNENDPIKPTGIRAYFQTPRSRKRHDEGQWSKGSLQSDIDATGSHEFRCGSYCSSESLAFISSKRLLGRKTHE